MKNLLIKYLEGNCTEEESDQLFFWIREKFRTTAGKAVIKEAWDEFEPKVGPQEKIKYYRVLDKVHRQINDDQGADKFREGQQKKKIWTIMTRVAAALLPPVLALLIYTNLPETQYGSNLNDLEITAPSGSRLHIELGDGTKVWLNSSTVLKYPSRFISDTRKVFLSGEAYFEVAHNSKIPFIVETDHVAVKATGTTFNVSFYPDDDIVETTLIEGTVILFESTGREIKTMLPDECVTFDTKSNEYIVEKSDTEKNIAWKDGLLVFKRDPIAEVAKKLERWYNIDVEFTSEEIKRLTYTATFSTETLSQTLELMALATPVSYTLIPEKKLPDGSFSKQKLVIGLKKK
ncbi:MAG: FecR family protein [Mangrovibacterium sp.]